MPDTFNFLLVHAQDPVPAATYLRLVKNETLLQDITKPRVLAYLEEQLRSGLAPGTVGIYLAFLKRSCSQAVQWGLLEDNPLYGLSLSVKIQNERVRYLLPAEYERLTQVCPLPWRRAVILAIHTGLRRTELFTLRWAYVDMQNRVIVFPPGVRKAGRSHSVELNDIAYDVLAEIQASQQADALTPP